MHTSSDLSSSEVQTLFSEVQVIRPRTCWNDRDDCLGEEIVSSLKVRAFSMALKAAKLILVFTILKVPKSRTSARLVDDVHEASTRLKLRADRDGQRGFGCGA